MSTTVYTYNDRLVGVGNDQILGTSQGGGSTYTAGNGIDITNDVISVDDTVAMASALPTTELGKFTIQSNVSGGPIEVICPTDQAPDTVFYQIDSVSGNAYAESYSYAVINYYYGETPADFNGSDDYILFTINDSISNIGSIYFYYTTAETGIGGPNLTTTSITGDSTGIVQSGTYRLKAQYNQAGTSSPYGKYLEIMFNWRNYATDAAQSLQWAQEALSKITFFGVVRPDPSLGITVNLDRYYLGNTTSTSTPSSSLACQVTVDSISKQQTVYLPNYIPSNWKQDVNVLLPYGTTSNPNLALYTYYGAYKQESGTSNMQYAVCVDHNWTNKIMTFISFDKNGDAFEKWTYNWGTSPKTWTTETIETGGGSTYTAGDYISIENDEIAVTGVGNLVAGDNITITESGNNITISSEGGGSTYTAGQYISIDSNDVIAVTGLAPVSGSDGITVNDNVVSLDTPVEIVAGDNITISVTGASAIISAQGSEVTEAQLYDATVTAVQAATGAIPTFTEGNCVDITSNVISWETSAGITDIISVTALPANPVATVIYLIPET